MAKILNWFFSRFKNGNGGGDDEDGFIAEYLGACITIIRHHIFWDKIPNLHCFARETLKALIEFIKSNPSETGKEPQKIMRDFIIKRIDQYINAQLRMICMAVQGRAPEAEEALRKYQSVVLGYIDKYIRIHQNGYFIENHVILSDKIINEWIRLAKRNGLSNVKNHIAFLTLNMKRRILNEIFRVKRGRQKLDNNGSLFWLNNDSLELYGLEKKVVDIKTKLQDNQDPSDEKFTKNKKDVVLPEKEKKNDHTGDGIFKYPAM